MEGNSPMTESINPHGTKHHFSKGSAEGSWKGMKKYLEKEMLCPSLQGRVQYDLTWYPRFGSMSAVYTIVLDGIAQKKFGTAYAYGMLTQQGYQIGYIDDIEKIPFTNRNEYTDYEFSEALIAYRKQSIDESITSDNPMIRMLAIVDRRIGKRRLAKLKDDVGKQPEWLHPFYLARMRSEGIISE